MDTFVLVIGGLVLVGMVFMLVQVAGMIHQAPRPTGKTKGDRDLSRPDDGKPGMEG